MIREAVTASHIVTEAINHVHMLQEYNLATEHDYSLALNKLTIAITALHNLHTAVVLAKPAPSWADVR